MELVQEIYELLNINWPERAMIAVRDADGEIKFSSVGKFDIPFYEDTGIYIRGEHCLFNNGIEKSPFLIGTSGAPDIITKSEYEAFMYTVEEKK